MSDDRKTPETRAQITDLERLRHFAAHVMATSNWVPHLPDDFAHASATS